MLFVAYKGHLLLNNGSLVISGLSSILEYRSPKLLSLSPVRIALLVVSEMLN